MGRLKAGLTAWCVVLSAVVAAPFVGASAALAGTDVTGVAGTAGNAQVSLTWTAPTDTTFPVTSVTERDGESSRMLPLTLAGFMLLIAAGGWLAVARRRRREV